MKTALSLVAFALMTLIVPAYAQEPEPPSFTARGAIQDIQVLERAADGTAVSIDILLNTDGELSRLNSLPLTLSANGDVAKHIEQLGFARGDEVEVNGSIKTARAPHATALYYHRFVVTKIGHR